MTGLWLQAMSGSSLGGSSPFYRWIELSITLSDAVSLNTRHWFDWWTTIKLCSQIKLGIAFAYPRPLIVRTSARNRLLITFENIFKDAYLQFSHYTKAGDSGPVRHLGKVNVASGNCGALSTKSGANWSRSSHLFSKERRIQYRLCMSKIKQENLLIPPPLQCSLLRHQRVIHEIVGIHIPRSHMVKHGWYFRNVPSKVWQVEVVGKAAEGRDFDDDVRGSNNLYKDVVKTQKRNMEKHGE